MENQFLGFICNSKHHAVLQIKTATGFTGSVCTCSPRVKREDIKHLNEVKYLVLGQRTHHLPMECAQHPPVEYVL